MLQYCLVYVFTMNEILNFFKINNLMTKLPININKIKARSSKKFDSAYNLFTDLKKYVC